ncbi:MAG TPA: hypothetical protein VF033_14890 [Steroidobacteraceae bacterium]|jgi:hypothetical protein
MTRRVTRLDELAQSTPPPRDLWPAIAEAIEADKMSARAESAPRRSRWMPAVGMAAAVALVAVGVIIGRNFGPAPDVATITAANGTGETGLIPAALRDANYRQQRDALWVEVNDRLKSMPEDERAKVAASLETLQRSIRDIEAALGKDPANALLQELLVNSCQEEMRALTAVRDSGSQEI